MARLFGTDGIRGVANIDLKPTVAYGLGRAVAHRLAGPGGSIVVGQDTRRSGDMFVAAITAGATSLGVDVHVAGVVPTPALAYLAGNGPFAAGIMVSASHNPADDNGLKVLAVVTSLRSRSSGERPRLWRRAADGDCSRQRATSRWGRPWAQQRQGQRTADRAGAASLRTRARSGVSSCTTTIPKARRPILPTPTARSGRGRRERFSSRPALASTETRIGLIPIVVTAEPIGPMPAPPLARASADATGLGSRGGRAW